MRLTILPLDFKVHGPLDLLFRPSQYVENVRIANLNFPHGPLRFAIVVSSALTLAFHRGNPHFLFPLHPFRSLGALQFTLVELCGPEIFLWLLYSLK